MMITKRNNKKVDELDWSLGVLGFQTFKKHGLLKRHIVEWIEYPAGCFYLFTTRGVFLSDTNRTKPYISLLGYIRYSGEFFNNCWSYGRGVSLYEQKIYFIEDGDRLVSIDCNTPEAHPVEE